jgi:hypothetical protein
VNQLAGQDLEGAVVLILYQGPRIEGFPSFAERVRTVADAGAAAVIAIIGPDVPWPMVARSYRQPVTRLASQRVAPIVGAISFSAAEALVEAAGGDMARLLNDQPGSSFRATALPLSAAIEVETDVRRYTSNNVVGRIPGQRETGESLLYLAHWDHLGECAPDSADNRICNGAVDNASGIAMMIEVAGRLANGARSSRDILFLATTAEEMGLLGAEHFAAEPVAPAETIVAAINMDTVAIHPAGEPLAVIGRGVAPLDEAIRATAVALRRTIDEDDEADPFVTRQDGWALARAGIPSVMVGGSFSDMALLGGFLAGPYHGPEDDLNRPIVLDGAAEDADFLVALGRRLADPARYQPPRR